MTAQIPQTSERKQWMSLLAKAAPARLAALMPDLPDVTKPDVTLLRPPEIGSVMVRGRVGGTGAPFNLGEMTITRCSLRLDGAVGHAWVQGRDKDHALRAAALDALLQTEQADDIRARILTPLASEAAASTAARATRAAATKVEFFTMVRGEDK